LGDAPTAGAGETAARPAEPLPDGPVEAVASVEATTETEAVAPTDGSVIAATVPGVAQSLRPLTRPAGAAVADGFADAIAEAAAAAVAEALAPPPLLDIAPDALAAGTRLVQIGAYSSQFEAERNWDLTAERYGSLLDGKRRVIEPASSGGQVFYRLRIEGFADVDDARRFCAALEADNAECVPAMAR
jgi:hypothetical protein